MRSRPRLLLSPVFAGLIVGAGCGPTQEYNSTEPVKTAPVPVPPRSAKVNKPDPAPKQTSQAKPASNL